MLLLIAAPALRAQQTTRSLAPSQAPRQLDRRMARPPLFTENVGQWESSTRLQGVVGSTTISFTSTGVRYFYNVDSLGARASSRDGLLRGYHLATEFIGADPAVSVTGERKAEAVYNYLLGRTRQYTGARAYQRVRYAGLYRGIDAIYYEHQGKMKYDFVLAPGADPARIALRYSGARDLRLTGEGRMEVGTPFGTVVEEAPYSYQDIGGRRVQVEASYRLLGGNSYGFTLGRHDPRYPVTIDPCLTVEYVTYFGGGGYDVVTGMAADSSGNTYAVGLTRAPDFPQIPPSGNTQQQNYIFVSKITPDGTRLIYSTLIAVPYTGAYGSRSSIETFETIGEDVEVTPNGEAFVALATNVDELPTTSDAHQQFLSERDSASLCGLPASQGFDSYVVRLNSTGAMIWGTYLGGRQNDYVTDITLDANNHLFLTGLTYGATCGAGTDSLRYPTSVPGDRFHPAVRARGFETFVSELLPNGQLGFSTLFGGSRNEIATRIATDRAGKIWILGSTNSEDLVTTSTALFPTRPAGVGSGYDLYIAAIDPAAGTLAYSSYYCDSTINGARTGLGINPHGAPGASFPTILRGFDRQDRRQGLLVSPDGTITFGGTTRSASLATTQNAFQRTRRGAAGTDSSTADCFVVKVNVNTRQVLAATYVGGSSFDALGGLGYDKEGNIVVAAMTTSGDYPLTSANIQRELRGTTDAVMSILAPDGAWISYSTYIGGTERQGSVFYEQMVYGTTVDKGGAIYLFGGTNSPDLPVTARALFSSGTDYYNGYIVKFAPPGTSNIGTSPYINFPPQACPAPMTLQHSLFNAGGIPLVIDSVVFRQKKYFSLVNSPTFPLSLEGCSASTLEVRFDPTFAPCDEEVYDTVVVYASKAETKVIRIAISATRPCLYFFFDKTQIINNDYSLGKGAIFVFTAYIDGTQLQHMTIKPRPENRGIFMPRGKWDNTPIGNGPNLISFQVNSADTGYYCETFDVTVQPCNRTEVLKICAYIRTGLFSTQRPIDLGVVSCGETNYPLVIRNTGNDSLMVKLLYVGGPTPADVEYDQSITAARKIPAGDSLTLDIHFRPKGVGKREAVLVFDTDQGFDFQRQQWVTITAELDTVEFNLTASDVEGAFGEIVSMPVQYAPVREGRAPTTELTFLTKFDPSMLDVVGVDGAGTLTDGWTLEENVFEPGRGGRVKLKMPPGGRPLTGSGLLTKLRLKVLRGSAESTPLRVELAGASKGCFLANIDTGFAFRLSAECAAYNRLLSSSSRLLKQSLPNPAGGFVTIPYTIPEPGGNVTLTVFDAMGRRVTTLLDEHLAGGNGEVRFDAGRLSPGLYYYRLTIDGTASDTRTMMIER